MDALLHSAASHLYLDHSAQVLRPYAAYLAAHLAHWTGCGVTTATALPTVTTFELLRVVRAVVTLTLFAGLVFFLLKRLVAVCRGKNAGPGTYLLDVATFDDFRPEWTVGADEWARRAQKWFNMDPDDIAFARKILDRSGIGEYTHFPPGIAMFPPDLSIASARYEAEVVMFGCIDQLFKRNGVRPKDVDILIVNCSLFNPTPSLTAMVINNYKMREDIVSFNLSGMGCSAGVIAVHLASELLKVSPKKDPIAIVVSMENITQNIYMGREKAMMVANSLFRMGGAAVMLTRNSTGGSRPPARWRLKELVRVHMGADTAAYTCVFQDVDKENKLGVRLDKNLMRVAAKSLERNMTRLGPLILPWHEQLRYVALALYRRYCLWRKPELAQAFPPVVPNFKTAVQHICIHAGGTFRSRSCMVLAWLGNRWAPLPPRSRCCRCLHVHLFFSTTLCLPLPLPRPLRRSRGH